MAPAPTSLYCNRCAVSAAFPGLFPDRRRIQGFTCHDYASAVRSGEPQWLEDGRHRYCGLCAASLSSGPRYAHCSPYRQRAGKFVLPVQSHSARRRLCKICSIVLSGYEKHRVCVTCRGRIRASRPSTTDAASPPLHHRLSRLWRQSTVIEAHRLPLPHAVWLLARRPRWSASWGDCMNMERDEVSDQRIESDIESTKEPAEWDASCGTRSSDHIWPWQLADEVGSRRRCC